METGPRPRPSELCHRHLRPPSGAGSAGARRTRPPAGMGGRLPPVTKRPPRRPRHSAGEARVIRRTNAGQGADPAGPEPLGSPPPAPPGPARPGCGDRGRRRTSPSGEGKRGTRDPARPDSPCRRRICCRNSSFSSISRVRDGRPGSRDVIAARPFPCGRGGRRARGSETAHCSQARPPPGRQGRTVALATPAGHACAEQRIGSGHCGAREKAGGDGRGGHR